MASVPRLEVSDPGTLTFRSLGPARYFGGEHAMAEYVGQLVEQAVSLVAVGGVRVGIADGRFAATVAARQRVVVPSGGSAAFLAPQSVQLLARWAGVPSELVHLLERLGLHRLGQVAALPVADLEARFGPLGSFVHRLAAGGDDRPPGVYEAPIGVGVQRVFEPPLHHSDAVVFAARQVAEELIGSLSAEGRVTTQVSVVAETEHGERSERVWQRSTGLSGAAIVERVRWQLEGWAHDQHLTAGVVLLRIDPVEVRTDDGVQLGMWGGRSQADEWAARTVARLVALAGEEQVLVPAAAGGRHAGDGYRWMPAVGVELDQPAQRFRPSQGPWPGSLPGPAPAIVHEPMVPLEVLDSEGAAVRVSGRGFVSAPPAVIRSVATGTAQVRAWAGPWPIDERWWDTAKARRLARFQLLTTEGRLWLAVVEGGRWWLSAQYR
jgi:protein ImuB